MKSIIINEKPINIPESFADLSILKFQIINKIEDVSPIDKHLNIIACVTDLNIEEVYKLSLLELQEINTCLQFLFSPTDINQQVQRFIIIDDTKLYFQTDLQKLEIGEFIDIQNLIKTGSIDNLHKIISILYRPRVESTYYKSIIDSVQLKDVELVPYDSSICEALSSYIQDNISIQVAYSALVFFCLIMSVSLPTSKSFFQRMKKKMMMKKLMKVKVNNPNLIVNMDGLFSSKNSLMGM